MVNTGRDPKFSNAKKDSAPKGKDYICSNCTIKLQMASQDLLNAAHANLVEMSWIRRAQAVSVFIIK